MKEERLEEIKKEVLNCQKCPLYKTRINPVVGEGNLNANIMLIGESPGANEDRTGRPFCGAAGKILDELLESEGIKRENVYITNILKDRPPDNRSPKAEEIKACTPYLERQIEIIRPKVICPLGNFAASFIFKKFGLEGKLAGISKIHGQVFVSSDLFSRVTIVPLYHPAVVAYNVNMKETLKKDFKALKNIERN